MKPTLSPLQRARLALDLLSQSRPALPPAKPTPLPDAPAIARETAKHAEDLSRALAAVVQTGDAGPHAHVITDALKAQHALIRRVLGLPQP